MKTWVAACRSKQPARVVIPSGVFLIYQIVFAGPCRNTEPIVVQIDATLKGGDDVSQYVSAEWILFEKINGLIVTGRGTLDGQGSKVWKYNDCHVNQNCQKLPVVRTNMFFFFFFFLFCRVIHYSLSHSFLVLRSRVLNSMASDTDS